MTSSSATVLHGCREGVHVLRFIGDIRYPIAPSVTEFLAKLFDAGGVCGFVIDLTETTSIDSTNLGVIARLGLRVRECCGQAAVVVAAAPHIRTLLDSMGITGVCAVAEQRPASEEAVAAVAATESVAQTELARVMLDAHRALIDLSRSNRERFDAVVTELERATRGG